MVSELSSSPTQSSSSFIKTYAFSFGDGDSPLQSPPMAAPHIRMDEPRNSDVSISAEERDLLSSFASGMLAKFDQTMHTMKKTDTLSRSLPNVFVSTLVRTNSSSSHTSTSNSDISKDELDDTEEVRFYMDEDITSPLHLTTTTNGKEEQRGTDCIDGCSNWGNSPDSVLSFDDLNHSHWRMEPRSTLGSTDSGSYVEQVDVVPSRNRTRSV